MDLSTAFLGSMNVNTDMLGAGQGLAKAEQSKSNGQKFDSYYDSYRNSRQDAAHADRTRTSRDRLANRPDNAGNRQAADDRQQINSKDKKVNESNVQKSGEATETKKTKETKSVGTPTESANGQNNISDTDKAELEKNIVEEVSEALGISEEDLALIMQQLNIQPVQLTQKEDVIKLVQEYLQIEEPAQMLTAPNFTGLVNEVEKAVKEALVQPETPVINEPEVLLQQKPAEEQTVKAETKKEPVVEVESRVAEQNAEEHLDKNVVEDIEIPVETNEDAATVVAPESADDLNSTGGQGQQASNMFSSNQPNSGANTQTQQAAAETNTNNSINGFANVNQAAAQAKEVAAPSRTPAAQRMETVIQQIADKIKVDIKFDSKEMNLILKPESLGNISLKLVSETGGVTAQFIAESQRAKEIIEANMSQLKDSLQQQGISVNQMSVEVGSDGQSEQMRQFLNEQAKSGRRIQELLSREGFGDEAAAAQEQNVPASLDESVGNRVDYEA